MRSCSTGNRNVVSINSIASVVFSVFALVPWGDFRPTLLEIVRICKLCEPFDKLEIKYHNNIVSLTQTSSYFQQFHRSRR